MSNNRNFWEVEIHKIEVVEAPSMDDAIEISRIKLVQELESPIGKFAFDSHGPLRTRTDASAESISVREAKEHAEFLRERDRANDQRKKEIDNA